MTTIDTEALTGTWQAVLADQHGYTYDSVLAALEALSYADEDVSITVVRGSAAPVSLAGDRPKLPGSYHDGDVAYRLTGVWLEDFEDPSIGGAARLEQAKAMAAGLNAEVALKELESLRVSLRPGATDWTDTALRGYVQARVEIIEEILTGRVSANGREVRR